MEFAAALPLLRRRIAADLKQEGLSREKVLATIVSLLEKTLIRVGNNEYADQNKSYGITTMRRKHVDIKGSTLRFEFTASPVNNGSCRCRTRGGETAAQGARIYKR